MQHVLHQQFKDPTG